MTDTTGQTAARQPTPTNLDTAGWRAGQALFLQLLECSPEERAQRLAALSDAAPDVVAQVRHLLTLDAGPTDVLPGIDGVQRAAAAVLHAELPQEELAPGMAVGSWRIIRPLAQGGMGSVYLAERDAGSFHQSAALKLVRHDMASPETIQRFVAERRILAGLDHPGIARLIEGGVHGDGRPYFVMEYVKGRTLLDHADEHGLDPRARVRLMVEVCQAVGFAHRRLLVHRDIKPANLLVDERARVRLVDFGLAKALAEDGASSDATTRWIRRLTPEYAAPEQLLGGTITTATDVYGLGLVLYELLTGVRPHRDTAERLAGADDIALLRIAPARALRERARAASTSGERRRLRRWAREVEHDLESIVRTALRYDADRRYASAEALAEDLERWLDGRPLRARRDTFGYRLRLFARRQPALAVTLAISLALAVVGTGGMLWQALHAREQARRAEVSRDFVLRLVGALEPARGGAPVPIVDLLDRGLERVRALHDEPELQLELFTMLIRLYDLQEQYARAQSLGDELLASTRARFGPAHPRTVRLLVATCGPLFATGRFVEAEQRLREALSLAERVLGGDHPDTLRARARYGVTLKQLGRDAEAERELSLAVEGLRGASEASEDDLVLALSALGSQRQDALALDAAEALYREALAAAVRAFGPRHMRVAEVRSNLGTLLEQRLQVRQALMQYDAALDIDRSVFGPRHMYVASDLNNRAMLQLILGDAAAARRDLAEGLAICEQAAAAGRWPGMCVRMQANLALAMLAAGDPAGAAAIVRASTTRAQKVLGPGQPLRAQVLLREAMILRAIGEPRQAARSLGAAGAWLEAHPGAVSAAPLLGLDWRCEQAAQAALEHGSARATVLLERCLAERREVQGAEHWRTAEAHEQLAQHLLACGQPGRAAEHWAAAERAWTHVFSAQDARARRARTAAARALVAAPASPGPA
jgi:serine/threonine-protein kinase